MYKNHGFVEYTPRKCFNNLLESRREGDEKPHSGVVAETMKLHGNNSRVYQFKDRFRHTITKYLGNERIQKATNETTFKRLNVVKKT